MSDHLHDSTRLEVFSLSVVREPRRARPAGLWLSLGVVAR